MNLVEAGEVRVFNRVLADRLGDREAMFLGQLHFWLTHGQHNQQHDGRQWVRKSAKQWHDLDFSFWSVRTVERIISRLEAQGILLSRPGTISDQRKIYTIDYDHETLRPTDKVSEGVRQNDVGGTDKMAVPTIEDQEDRGTRSTPKVADVELPPSGFDRDTEIDLVRKNPTHGPTLARFWRRCMSEFGHTSATQPGMKVKDQKMLKEMIKLLPDGGERMLLNVLEHYALFVNFAREGYNVNLAARPQVQKLMLVVEGIAEFDTPAMSDDTDYSNLGLKGLLDDSDDSNADDA